MLSRVFDPMYLYANCVLYFILRITTYVGYMVQKCETNKKRRNEGTEHLQNVSAAAKTNRHERELNAHVGMHSPTRVIHESVPLHHGEL